MKNSSKVFVGIATGGYIGFLPFSPGTFGSLLGIPLFYFLSFLPLLTGFFFVAAFFLVSIWIAGQGEKALNAKDPGCIVIDEIVGMAVTFFAIPFSGFAAIVGFAAFRFFDILKPFPVRYLEKKYSGGLGIVIDDVAAGIMSNLLLHAILAVLNRMQ